MSLVVAHGVVKFTVDGYSQGDPGLFTVGGILHDFGYFLQHPSILYAKLMAVSEDLKLANWLFCP